MVISMSKEDQLDIEIEGANEQLYRITSSSYEYTLQEVKEGDKSNTGIGHYSNLSQLFEGLRKHQIRLSGSSSIEELKQAVEDSKRVIEDIRDILQSEGEDI